ncbi:unnamed protein product [Polarella glacialis]|uniref:Reverse transcriptase zinc-binding domain-containing protein n=1 Tax=Polarella glacialis TaxID=89957 RepID=A0A813EKB5_POLGL|nr:unnamed protein product [Polarella glacialis]
MVQAGQLPLAVALDLFEAKVEGSVRFARWLLVIAPNAQRAYNEAYENWARAFLGSPAWRGAAIARGEVGWKLDGFHRAILDMAVRRAKLWTLPPGDLHGLIFQAACRPGSGSWADRSLQILNDTTVPDFPCWDTGDGTLPSYAKYVQCLLEKACLLEWRQAVSTHVSPIPYLDLSTCPSPNPRCILQTCGLSWPTLLGHVFMCRMRAGLVDLGHIAHRRSQAKIRYCPGCNQRVRAALIHALAVCPRWQPERSLLPYGWDTNAPLALASAVLLVSPSDPAFSV